MKKEHTTYNLIQRYLDLKYNYLLEKMLLIQVIRTNDITSIEDLLDILQSYPEQVRRSLQNEYYNYIQSPEKYVKDIPKGLLLFS